MEEVEAAGFSSVGGGGGGAVAATVAAAAAALSRASCADADAAAVSCRALDESIARRFWGSVGEAAMLLLRDRRKSPRLAL